MSKKIDSTLKELTKALKAHAKIVGGSAVSLKKAQRASSKVSETAAAYAKAVTEKSKMGNPFEGLLKQGLEKSTLDSLAAERDSIARHLTGPITVPPAAEAAADEQDSGEQDSDEQEPGQNEPDQQEPDEQPSTEQSSTEQSSTDASAGEASGSGDHSGEPGDTPQAQDEQHPSPEEHQQQ